MRLKTENAKLKSANIYLKRKGCEQDVKVSDLTSLLQKVQGQFSLSNEVMENLSKSASSLPVEIFKEVSKKVKTTGGRSKVVHPELRILRNLKVLRLLGHTVEDPTLNKCFFFWF